MSNGIEVFREKYLNSKDEFDLIIIMLGTNDQLNYFDCSAAETAEALRMFVTEYQDNNNDIKSEMLVISPVYIRNFALEHPIFKELYNKKSIAESMLFAENISKIASQEGVHFIDAEQYASASDLDGIHMNPDEHKKLAYAIAKKINAILFQR